MTPYLLCKHVHVCPGEHDTILLDLRHGEYIGIDSHQVIALAKAVRGWPTARRRADIVPDMTEAEIDAFSGRLAARGLLTRNESEGKEAVPLSMQVVDRHICDDNVDDESAIRLADVGRLALAYASARFALRWRTLEQTAVSIRRRKARQPDESGVQSLSELRTATSLYHRLRPLAYTAKLKCMLDSLALIEFLARYGLFPNLVIGVRPRPFAAHAWVQYRSYCLNGAPDDIRRYTPIFTI